MPNPTDPRHGLDPSQAAAIADLYSPQAIRNARCAWCDPADPTGPVRWRITWQHDDKGCCWCEHIPGNDRRHESWACNTHKRRELQDLRDLDLRVLETVEDLR